jgi:RNA polymerase sigma-70 factor (ECF subfamily)
MESDDIELIVKVARGDRGALAELYDRHVAVMSALAERMLRDPYEAEDVLHDVIVEAWQHAGEYDPAHSSVCVWLLVRLRSRCLDRIRFLSRRRQHGNESGPADAIMPAQQADMLDRNRVLAALAGLNAEHRRVLELAYLHGLSSSEVAAHLDIPIGTVKSRMSAGIAQLRKALVSRATSQRGL